MTKTPDIDAPMTAPAKVQPLAAPPTIGVLQTLGDIIQSCMASDIDAAKVDAMLTLYREIIAPAKAMEALMQFRRECPPIPRRRENQQFTVTRNGVRRFVRFANVHDALEHCNPYLTRHGLSVTFGDAVPDGHGFLLQSCRIMHEGGHSISASVPIAMAAGAGQTKSKCSPAQVSGGVLTYARMKALEAVIGLPLADDDNDGADDAPPDPADLETITPEEASAIEEELHELGANLDRFKRHIGPHVVRFRDIRRGDMERVQQAIETKKRQVRDSQK